jgi:hypothetical protein
MGNTKIELEETEWEDMEWINLADSRGQQGAVVDTVMNLQVPLNGRILV